MHLLIASGTWPPEVSGQAQFARHLFDVLKSQITDIKIIAYGEQNRRWRDPIFLVKRSFFRHIKYFFHVLRIAWKIDIVYAQDLISSGFPASLACMFYPRVSFIIRLGGDFLWEKMINEQKIFVPLIDYYHQKKSFRESVYLLMYRLVLRRADAVIFNTERQARLYQDTFSLPPAKIRIVKNPIPVLSYIVSDSISHPKTKIIVFAGRLIRVKNVAMLIEVCKEISGTFTLVIIGDGADKHYLQDLAKGDHRIQFIGTLSQNELWRMLKKSYLFVLPSLTELSPNIALECLALKKPVLLTRENFLPENIRRYCMMFNPMDKKDLREKLLFLLREKEYIKYLHHLQHCTVKRDWSDVAGDHLKIFKKII